MEDAEDREPSVASSSDFYGDDDMDLATPESPRKPAADSLAVKRKAEDTEPPQEKKRKLDSPPPPTAAPEDLASCAGLPPAVWQHVFLYCSASTLGRLLQVNRSFHSYLTAVRNVSSAKPASGFLRLLKSESIWASARNMHPVRAPRPLPGFSEMQMWQLALSRRCQFCNRESSFTPGEKVWQRGPGVEGARVIWPFRIRACGPCLLERSQTDTSLLLSTASILRPALPFALVTSDQHYIAAYTLQAATTPANVDITKYYYKPDVDDMAKELANAQSLGPAAAEEWAKGLDSRGKEWMKVAENWERWEVKYRWWESNQQPKRSPSVAPPSTSGHLPPTQSPFQLAPRASPPVIHAPVPATPTSAMSRPSAIPPQTITPHPGEAYPVQIQPPRGERNLHDANEAKANRKLEIERRAQMMDPSIPPNILRHMDSFKAAIQISQPMNDNAWSMLRPRLLAQLPAAQQAERENVARLGSGSTRPGDPPQDGGRDAKDVLDREWELSQRPIRERLTAIADEFTSQEWDHGRAVTFKNSPKFAVDLLVHVRRKFYAESDASSALPTGVAVGGSHSSARPKLVLDNMKWVYDHKLKPLTEQHRKELFLCNGLGCEGNTRFYGFEGVIQHYGAKHTHAFSSGTAVVAWRDAEWPEQTPFHPDPMSVESTFANAAQAAYGSYYGGYARAGTSTPHMQTLASPAPYGYGGQYNGPFAPPHAQAQGSAGYSSQPLGAPADPYLQAMGPPGLGPQAGVQPYVASAPLSHANATYANGSQAPWLPETNGPQMQTNPGNRDHLVGVYGRQVSTVIEATLDIWKQTSGIKDFPNSLRVYVLLHRVISKFHIDFNHEPKLSHFIDAFSSHQIPQALKDAFGLCCKTCQNEASLLPVGYPRQEDRREYTILGLFQHFLAQHSAPHPALYGTHKAPDWKEDMIELPSDRFISGLIHAPGMDDDKLHMIATVFPLLFPTPLPRIGVPAPEDTVSKDVTSTSHAAGTSGVATEKSAGSSLASPSTDSPMPPKPTEDEYDPQHPALVSQARTENRLRPYHRSPPTHRSRVYEDSQYYLSRTPMDDYEMRSMEHAELPFNPRMDRDRGAASDRAFYREDELTYGRRPDDLAYPVREGHPTRDYAGRRHLDTHQYYETDSRPEYRLVRDPVSRDASLTRGHAEADRFLEQFPPDQVIIGNPHDRDTGLRAVPTPSGADTDLEDVRRYTPLPNVPAGNDPPDHNRTLLGAQHKAPSTASNGSRYEEQRSGPGSEKRTGPHRRRDRHDNHIPARYYKLARDDPYPRGTSVGRAQSKRYDRYEEQRRRIVQQETPGPPTVDGPYDAPPSRDPSVDHGLSEGPPYPAPVAPRASHLEYVPVQDRVRFSPPGPPPGYRYAGSSEGARRPPPIYVDEYGYEFIPVDRDPRAARAPFPPAGTRYYQERPTYAPYDDRPSRRNGHPGEYVYYEESVPLPSSARRPAFEEGEAPYEPSSSLPPPPPGAGVKIETVPTPEGR